MTPLKIDVVSDIACPWCAVGISALERALNRLQDTIEATWHIHPFELNPQMGSDGMDTSDYLTQKYGSTPEQQAEVRETLRQRGAAAGFAFRPGGRDRIWNTFDAHRLLHWAGLPETQPAGKQLALKKALLHAYFTLGESPASHAVLQRVAGEVGLDIALASDVLSSGRYAEEVREQERFYAAAGIQSVPAFIVNDRYLISGGQPAEVFEDALRKIAAEEA